MLHHLTLGLQDFSRTVGGVGFEPTEFLMYRIYSPTPIRHLSRPPKYIFKERFNFVTILYNKLLSKIQKNFTKT